VLGLMISSQRGQTNVAVTYDASPAAALGSLSPVGVPKKAKVPWAAIGGAIALVAAIGIAVILKSGS